MDASEPQNNGGFCFQSEANSASPTQSKLGTKCIQTIDSNAVNDQQQPCSTIKSETYYQTNQSLLDAQSDTDNQNQCEDQLDIASNDDQSSEPSNDVLATRNGTYSTQRIKFSSSKSSSETTLDDRRLRRQIANCNERRRMQSINAGFQALRQFLPQRCGEKLSKAAILQQTAELIQSLQLEKGLRSADSDQFRSSNDEEASTDSDRPQCKKRRIAIKNEPKELAQEKAVSEASHLETRINEYIKVIEELREALEKEQQLRLLYEQKLFDLKSTLSASLGFGSMPTGLNLDCNKNVLQANVQQRSSSADGLLAPKNVCNNSSTLAMLYNNLAAVTEATLNYNNQVRMPRLVNNSLTALLSPTQVNGLHLGSSASFAPPPIQNMIPLVNLLAASLQSPHGSVALSSPSQAPVDQFSNSGNQPNEVSVQNNFFAIAEALRQIENENSKKFSNENLSADVLVR